MSLEEQFENLSLDSMKISTKNTDIFRKTLAIASDLCDDVNLVFSDEGLKIISMDTGHVCLTNIKFSRNFFDTYIVPKHIVIGVKLSNMVRILSCLESELVMEYSEDEPDFFTIRSVENVFKIRVIDLESEEMQIPEMEYDVEIDMDSNVLQKYVKNLAIFGEELTVETADDGIYISTSGDIGSGSIKLDGSRVTIRGSLKERFALKYMATFSKAASVSKAVTMSISNESPLKLTYMFDVESYISFYIAPKFTEDYDDEM